jgi:hypothetical protein
MRVSFDGCVSDGKLRIYDDLGYSEYLKTLNGRPVRIEIVRGNKRSTLQNRWMWGVAYKILSDYTGHTPEEIHAFCKVKFNPVTVEIANKQTGEIESLMVGGSTTEMSTIEFGEYKDAIQLFGAELGCQIPDPGEMPEQE